MPLVLLWVHLTFQKVAEGTAAIGLSRPDTLNWARWVRSQERAKLVVLLLTDGLFCTSLSSLRACGIAPNSGHGTEEVNKTLKKIHLGLQTLHKQVTNQILMHVVPFSVNAVLLAGCCSTSPESALQWQQVAPGAQRGSDSGV